MILYRITALRGGHWKTKSSKNQNWIKSGFTSSKGREVALSLKISFLLLQHLPLLLVFSPIYNLSHYLKKHRQEFVIPFWSYIVVVLPQQVSKFYPCLEVHGSHKSPNIISTANICSSLRVQDMGTKGVVSFTRLSEKVDRKRTSISNLCAASTASYNLLMFMRLYVNRILYTF